MFLAITGAGLCGGSVEEAQPRWENQVSLCCLPKPAGAHSASFANDLTRILSKVLFDERITKWWMLKKKKTSDAGELIVGAALGKELLDQTVDHLGQLAELASL